VSTVRRIYISLKRQAIPQSTVIYYNLQQSVVISGNLPISVTLPGTTIAYTVTARKEGRKEQTKEKHIYI
jgi:hypothetical protein